MLKTFQMTFLSGAFAYSQEPGVNMALDTNKFKGAGPVVFHKLFCGRRFFRAAAVETYFLSANLLR